MNFNPEITAPLHGSPLTSDDYYQILQANGVTDEMKLELFPMGRLSMILRLENIGDTFNSPLRNQ